MQLDLIGEAANGPPCLKVLCIHGEIFERSEFLTRESVGYYEVVEHAISDIECAKVAAERVSLETGRECWVVNYSRDGHNQRVVYRFSASEHTLGRSCPA